MSIEKIYKLTEEEKNRVANGIGQIKRGQILSNDEVEKEIDEWLSE